MKIKEIIKNKRKNKIENTIFDKSFYGITEKKNEKLVKNKLYKDTFKQELEYKKMNRWDKYNHLFRLKMLNNYIKKIPEGCYCYNKINCPFYSDNYKTEITTCHLEKVISLNNSNTSTINSLLKYKTYYELETQDIDIFLWDQIKICSYNSEY